MTHLADLRASLEQISASFKKVGVPPGGWLLYDFVLARGLPCEARALPAPYRPGVPRYCFYNTAQLVRQSRGKLLYCEGYASVWQIPSWPVYHAWAVDEAHRVVDATLDEPERAVYLGVPVATEIFNALIPVDGSGAIFLDRLDCVRAELIYALAPELRQDGGYSWWG